MTVREYMEQHGVARRTVYRWINEGKIKAVKKDNDRWDIIETNCSNNYDIVQLLQDQIEQLRNENKYLHDKLDQAQDDRQRSDTIIMQLTKQLEHKQLMLEDMQNRSWWRRVKMAFGFARA